MRRLRHWLEYVGLRLALLLVDALPLTAAAALAARLADIWYRLDRSRRRVAIGNILQSGIATTSRDAGRIARASFRHFGLVLIESLKSDRVLQSDSWHEHATLDIAPETLAVLRDPGRGVILVSGHLGNWEVAAQLLSFIKPVVGVTRNMNNPHTDRLIKQRKPRNRFRLTPKHDADAGRFLSALRQGEVLALLMDQHARNRGMAVDFFGIPASTHTSPALLHLITGAPMVFGYCLRTGPMSFVLRALPPLHWKRTGNKEQDIRKILETLARQLETAIRSAPEQYLWAHRRWR